MNKQFAAKVDLTSASMEKLGALREKIAGLKAGRQRVEALWPPVDGRVAEINQQVDSALDMLAHPEADLRRNKLEILFIAAHAAELKENLVQRAQKIWPQETVSPKEKAVRLAKLDREILELERDEEAICVALEAAGQDVFIDRRGDLNPAIFLEAD